MFVFINFMFQRIECETKHAEDIAWIGTTICVWENYLHVSLFFVVLNLEFDFLNLVGCFLV